MAAALRVRGRYSAVEGWLYDAVIADAVAGMSKSVLDALQLDAGGRTLDVGCGGGQATALLPRGTIALDLSLGMARRAKRRLPADPVVCGSAHSLPVQSETLDAVVSCYSVKHWPDPLAGLRECVRVLRPGGRLAVLELRRDATPAEVARLIREERVPRLLRVPFRFFATRTVIAASPDGARLRQWCNELDLDVIRCEPLPGWPAIALLAERR